jgi:hypothetical protein
MVALFVLWPFAYASPIDPTWIDGFWDDGDHDDVVILVTSMATAADMNLVAGLLSVLFAGGVIADCFPRSTGPRVRSPTQHRSSDSYPPRFL